MAFGDTTKFDFLCRVCEHKGKNREADKFCQECQDYYCSTCIKVHDDVPSLTGHKILSKGQFSSGSIKISGPNKIPPLTATERCDRHRHHFIDMYCQNHDDVGCGTCMAVDHRLCKDIFYIPEFLQNNGLSPDETNDTQQKLKSLTKTLAEHQENFKREKYRLLKSKAKILEHVKKFRKEVNDRLDKLEKNTVTDIEDSYKPLINKMDEEMKLLEKSKTNVSTTLNKLASTTKSAIQNFVNAKKAEKTADKITVLVDEIKQQTVLQDIDFNTDQRISSLLEGINVLGQIAQDMSVNAENTSIADIHKKEALLKINKISKKYCVRVQSDKSDCNIVSACTLEDGEIILSDRGNNKLKHVDSSTFTVIDYCDLPDTPWQVCSAEKQQAAVCLPNQLEVQFVSLTDGMNLTNKIITDFRCYGVAYADGNLYISDSNTSVYIYNVSGRKLKHFSKDQFGQKLFYGISSLAVSQRVSRIYVADINIGLIILNSSGKVVGRFNGSHLEGAFDSCLTGRGSLLVCGFNNVLQFGLNGVLIGEVVNFDFQYTRVHHRAICCNQQMSQMLIGRDKDEIEVYDLI